MSHLQRAASIVGTLLIGIAAFLVVSDRMAGARGRRASEPPVDELADELKEAWSEYHKP